MGKLSYKSEGVKRNTFPIWGMLVYAMKQEPSVSTGGGDGVEPSKRGSASRSNACGTTGRKAEDLRLEASFLHKQAVF